MKKKTLATLLLSLFCLGSTQTAVAQEFCGPSNWDFEADFLYWATNFNAISSVDIGVIEEEDSIDATLHIRHPDQKWDPGVRLAAGWCSCNNWDIQASWTHFYNSNTINRAPFSLIVNSEELFETTGNSRFVFRYNDANLDVGTTLCLNPCVLIHPFAGVHAVWLNLDSRLNLLLAIPDAADTIATINVDKRAWGVGPRIGINTLWGNWCGLGLVANINGGLVYGEHRARADVNIDVASGADLMIHLIGNSFWQLMSTVQMQSGLSYQGCICNNQYRINALWECNMINQAADVLIFDKSISMQGLTLSFEYMF